MQHNSKYFEGILQLRDVSDEVVAFAIREIEKNEVYIAKLKRIKNGVDIYVSKQRFLRTLGTKLQKEFGGQLIVSKKIHTKSRMSGRDLYRISVLFRSPSFKKNQIIEYKGDKIKIVNMGKKIFAKELKTGKKLNISYKDMLRYSLHFL
jgi:NMD protein affecting ribosome stability and mRNA decay